MTGWCPLLPPPRVSCCGSPYCLWKDELACDRREPSLLWVSAPPMFGLELGFARRLLPTMLIFSSPTGTCGADETPRRGPLLLGRCILGARTAHFVPGRSALLARGLIHCKTWTERRDSTRYGQRFVNATVVGAEPWPQVHPGILRGRGNLAAACEGRASAASWQVGLAAAKFAGRAILASTP